MILKKMLSSKVDFSSDNSIDLQELLSKVRLDELDVTD